MLLTHLRRFYLLHFKKWGFQVGRRRTGEAVVFTHIPKSAGTSFTHSLATSLQSKLILGGFDHSLFGAFNQFETISPEQKAVIYAPSDSLPQKADIVSGHFSVSTVRRFYPNANYCTVLREPECRLLSHWLFWRQFSDENLIGWGVPWRDRVQRARRPLVEFLRDTDVACQTDNLAVRMLLWPDRRIPSNGFIDESQDLSLLNSASAELQRFDFIGLIEDSHLSQNIENWLKTPFSFLRLNETQRADAGFPVNLDNELTEEARALLKTRSRLDLVLWQVVFKRQYPNININSIKKKAFAQAVDRYKSIQERN